jgi:hypothetical protein
MRFILLPLVAVMITLCASCATQSRTMPSASDLDRSNERFRAMAQPQFDDLERRRASGALSPADYEREKASLEYRVQQQAVDAAWTAHALAESDRKATGIPTPDQPQQIQAGGVPGSLYQSHNDQYSSGSQGSFGAALGQGYQPGGSIIGNRSRSF